ATAAGSAWSTSPSTEARAAPRPACAGCRRTGEPPLVTGAEMDFAGDPRALLRHLYDAAVRRALPLHNTAAFLPPPPRGRTVVIGAGKAGGSMAQAVEALWPADAPLEGLVVTRYHHTPA